ncbi:hypothetical protein FO519_009023 [Halicephalobus sp. NKZ332]|nr:hypothetical protein FO519_009023 [Halicephalobus sp. NKZ332]
MATDNREAYEIKDSMNRKPGYVDFFCGWSAGCIETMILYPQNKLIFRQQLFGVAANEAIRQLKSEGLGLLYRGLLPPLLMRTTTRSIMFGMYDKYQYLLGCSNEKMGIRYSLTLCHAQAAFLAGATEALLCPLERVQTLLQSNAYHKDFRNTKGAFIHVNKFGLKEFYRGFSLIVFRNGTSNALFFTLREPLKHGILDNVPANNRNNILNLLADFGSGAVLGASISTLFFPINVVKTRMQSTLGTQFLSPLAVFRIVWKERNGSVKELFRGVHLNFTRSLMAWGITNTAFEFLKRCFEKKTGLE